MPLNTIDELIADFRQGKMVILMDDEDRENEGDLILAAEKVTPEAINFMAKYGRGLICLTLNKERCERLRLPLMVSATNDRHSTNFTVSIEAADGVTTGISAADRAVTVRKAVALDAKPSDLVQPGHIFPLMAQPGGVLTRAGHTEAGCDLARLSGFEAASVIVEILNDDGSMARRPVLEKFAQQHDLKIGAIADLIHYRRENEKTVERIAECDFPSEYGKFRLIAYRDSVDHGWHSALDHDQYPASDHGLHLALVMGDIKSNHPTLVRVHLQDTLCDVLGSQRNDVGWPLRDTLRYIAAAGAGVAVVLRKKEDAGELVRRIRDYQLKDKGVNFPKPAASIDLRTYGAGAQILADIGVGKMRVLGAPKKVHGLAGFGLEIVEYVELKSDAN